MKKSLLILCFPFLLTACDNKDFSCSSDEVKSLAIKELRRSPLTVEKIFGSELLDYYINNVIIQDILPYVNFEISNVKVMENDQTTGFKTCNATFKFTLPKDKIQSVLDYYRESGYSNELLEEGLKNFSLIEKKVNYSVEPVDDGKNMEVIILKE